MISLFFSGNIPEPRHDCKLASTTIKVPSWQRVNIVPKEPKSGDFWRSDRVDDGVENVSIANTGLPLYQLALDSDLKTYGEDHPDVAIDRNNLGMAYNSLGQYDKAIDYFQLALGSLEKVFGQEHPYVKTVKANLESAKDSRLKRLNKS